MKKQFSAIFFDFDGTLGDTDPDIRQAWQNAIKKLGLNCPGFDNIFRVGPSLPDTAKMLFPELDDEKRLLLQNTYKHFYDDAPEYSALPYPGILDVLTRLHNSGVKIYIVTNKRVKPTLKLMKKFQITQICSGMFTPDIVSADIHLTKSELLNLALKISAVDPQNALMVGDTELDIAAGKNNNVSTCAVTWGYGRTSMLEKADADFTVNTAVELLDL